MCVHQDGLLVPHFFFRLVDMPVLMSPLLFRRSLQMILRKIVRAQGLPGTKQEQSKGRPTADSFKNNAFPCIYKPLASWFQKKRYIQPLGNKTDDNGKPIVWPKSLQCFRGVRFPGNIAVGKI